MKIMFERKTKMGHLDLAFLKGQKSHWLINFSLHAKNVPEP